MHNWASSTRAAMFNTIMHPPVHFECKVEAAVERLRALEDPYGDNLLYAGAVPGAVGDHVDAMEATPPQQDDFAAAADPAYMLERDPDAYAEQHAAALDRAAQEAAADPDRQQHQAAVQAALEARRIEAGRGRMSDTEFQEALRACSPEQVGKGGVHPCHFALVSLPQKSLPCCMHDCG